MRPQLHADLRFAKLRLCGPLAQLEEHLTLNQKHPVPLGVKEFVSKIGLYARVA